MPGFDRADQGIEMLGHCRNILRHLFVRCGTVAFLIAALAAGAGSLFASSASSADSCLVKTLVAKQAYSVCRADNFWYVVGVSYYCIPGAGILTVRDFNKKTKQECKFKEPPPPGAELAGAILQVIAALLRPLDESCQAPSAIGEITLNECVGDFWEKATYLEYQCLRPEGELRLARPAKSRTRTTTPCTEKPPPTVPGAPKDEDDDD
jgi:hypothetical protein